MRLGDVRKHYGDRVEIHWRPFLLIPDVREGRVTTEKTREGRQRARVEEPRAEFDLPAPGIELPSSSVPALTAAKAAECQGAAMFEEFHRGLFRAHFRDNLNIGRADVLSRVARDSGLDTKRFEEDCASDEPYRAMLHDYAEGVAWFGVSAIPTVIFNEKVSLVGAVPLEQYRLLIDWMLAGEPGGMIPLDFGDPAASAAGHSAAEQR